jgi:hypothetical protein
MHQYYGVTGAYSTVYLNRSPEEASEYVRTLQAVLRSVAASDGNMEQVCKPFDGVSARFLILSGIFTL